MSEKQWHRKRKQERIDRAMRSMGQEAAYIDAGFEPIPEKARATRRGPASWWARIKRWLVRRFCRHEDVGMLTPPGWTGMRREYHICRKCGKVLSVRYFAGEGGGHG